MEFVYKRRKSKQIWVGDVPIGGDAPIAIQSMTNTATADVAATVKQIQALAEAGCQLVRLTVPDNEAAAALGQIIPASPVPLIADIHFDYRLALAALEQGISALRINPGNIGGAENVRTVAKAALERGVPIRIGVNSGSLSKEILTKHGGVTADALVESALQEISLLEAENFTNIKISLKASNVPLMLEAYRKLAERCDYPFHIGVTEAGTPKRGSIKSAVGIGALLAEGLGDTLRVSLSGDPVEEVFVAKEILRSLGLYNKGVEYIVCPTCGRTKIDLPVIAAEIEERVEALHIEKPLKLAVMGCVVNGPGEAREADFGLAGGDGAGVLFAAGEIVGKYPADKLADEFMKLLQANI
jgi:(E)-4-hydroxy-3-methylbut-2-enyl-diphosphate synthase